MCFAAVPNHSSTLLSLCVDTPVCSSKLGVCQPASLSKRQLCLIYIFIRIMNGVKLGNKSRQEETKNNKTK